MTSVALGEVAEINPRGPGRNELSPDTLLDFVPMADVSEDGRMCSTERRPYREVAKGFTAFQDGDVLLAKITPCFENNKIALANVSTPYAFGSTEFHVIRGKSEKALPKYLAHFLRQDRIRYAGERRMTGSAGQRRVPKAFLEELEVPLPPLDEQKRIAAILDQADALRRLRHRAIDRLNTLGQAIFYEMFGDAVNGSNLKDAPTVGDALESGLLISIQDGNHGERHPKVEDFSDEGTPFIMANCFSNGALVIDRAYRLSHYWLDYLRKGFSQPGDVLLTHKGTVGETAIVPDDCDQLVLSPQVTFYRPSEDVLPEYLHLFFQTAVFQAILKKGADQSTRAYIGLNRQKELPLLIPSVETQRELVSRIRSINPLLMKQVEGLKTTEALFSSLQSHAFRGGL